MIHTSEVHNTRPNTAVSEIPFNRREEIDAMVQRMGKNTPDMVIAELIALVKTIKPDRTYYWVEVLGRVGKKAMPTLIEVLNANYYSYARCKAADALGNMGEEALEPLLAALKKDTDSDDSVRNHIVAAIAKVAYSIGMSNGRRMGHSLEQRIKSLPEVGRVY